MRRRNHRPSWPNWRRARTAAARWCRTSTSPGPRTARTSPTPRWPGAVPALRGVNGWQRTSAHRCAGHRGRVPRLVTGRSAGGVPGGPLQPGSRHLRDERRRDRRTAAPDTAQPGPGDARRHVQRTSLVARRGPDRIQRLPGHGRRTSSSSARAAATRRTCPGHPVSAIGRRPGRPTATGSLGEPARTASPASSSSRDPTARSARCCRPPSQERPSGRRTVAT